MSSECDDVNSERIVLTFQRILLPLSLPILMMERAGSSVTSLRPCLTTRRHPPENSNRLVNSFRTPVDQIQQHGCCHVIDNSCVVAVPVSAPCTVGNLLQTKEMDGKSQPTIYRGADKSLARPGRKRAIATEDFDVHIYYLL